MEDIFEKYQPKIDVYHAAALQTCSVDGRKSRTDHFTNVQGTKT
jgi:hypothetical protein